MHDDDGRVVMMMDEVTSPGVSLVQVRQLIQVTRDCCTRVRCRDLTSRRRSVADSRRRSRRLSATVVRVVGGRTTPESVARSPTVAVTCVVGRARATANDLVSSVPVDKPPARLPSSYTVLYYMVSRICIYTVSNLVTHFAVFAIGSRPSDHYFRCVRLFVCSYSFSQPSLIRFRSN